MKLVLSLHLFNFLNGLQFKTEFFFKFILRNVKRAYKDYAKNSFYGQFITYNNFRNPSDARQRGYLEKPGNRHNA